MQFAWAIGEALVLAVLVREWFSIRRELRRGQAAREAQAAQDSDDDDDERTPVRSLTSNADVTHAERQ